LIWYSLLYGDGVDNTVNVLVAICKGMQAVKLCTNKILQFLLTYIGKKKGKVFPYSLPSVGPGADPGVQAVSPQVT